MTEQKSRTAYYKKMCAEASALFKQGVMLEGNAFCTVLFAGMFDVGLCFSKSAVGSALLSAFKALGYAPGSWAAIDCKANIESIAVIRATLQPNVIVAYDAKGRSVFGADNLKEGEIKDVFGIRTLWLGNFKKALNNPREKRIMWERLQNIRATEKGM